MRKISIYQAFGLKSARPKRLFWTQDITMQNFTQIAK